MDRKEIRQTMTWIPKGILVCVATLLAALLLIVVCLIVLPAAIMGYIFPHSSGRFLAEIMVDARNQAGGKVMRRIVGGAMSMGGKSGKVQ